MSKKDKIAVIAAGEKEEETPNKNAYRISDVVPPKFRHRGNDYYRDQLTEEQLKRLAKDKKFPGITAAE